MFSSLLEGAIAGVNAATLTDVFLYVLLFVFFLSIWWKKSNKHHAFTNYAPTLLTTLGILGTFFGIVVGLLAFDQKNIDGSIEGLLAGMKTAFITSLVGMVLSVVYKVLVSTGLVAVKDGEAIDEDQIGVAELYMVMTEQRDGITDLNQAIGSGDESSLTGQLKLLRSDVNDAGKQSRRDFEGFQEKLWIKLQDFADMLSKSATETVIDALNQVIKDFNNNLTEQFGENFKELNKAVEKLVVWQENYRGQVEDMTRQYAQGVSAIADTQTAVAKIHEHTSQIPESMNKLGEVMTVNQHQIQELGRHLDAFKDVRDRAVEAVPEIRNQITQTVEGVQAATAQLVEGITGTAKKAQEAITQGAQEFIDGSQRVNGALQASSDVISQNSETIKTQFSDLTSDLNNNFRNLTQEVLEKSKFISDSLREAGHSLLEEAAQSRKSFEGGLESMRDQFSSSIQAMADQQASHIQGLITGLNRAMEDAVNRTGESVEKNVKMLDKALEHEINQSMQQMGGALTSITGQFTQDYRELVDQMSLVVRARA